MNASTECIFRNFESSRFLQSSIKVTEKKSVPDNQGWSTCENCAWKDERLYFFGEQCLISKIDLSWSSWGEFFHSDHSDIYTASCLQYQDYDFSNYYYVERPVFILPLITFHVGHILIDLIEQVYHTMILTYGAVRKDSLIILDVSGKDEKKILQEKIFQHTFDKSLNTFGLLLSTLTDLPILTIDSLKSMSKMSSRNSIIFKSLHVGLDLTHSFFAVGYEYHPCLINLPLESSNETKTTPIGELQKRYKQFQEFLWSVSPLHIQTLSATKTGHTADLSQSNTPLNLVIIQRRKNRMLLNLDQLLASIAGDGTLAGSFQSVSVAVLEDMPFTEQLQLFLSADILVSMAGSALHNVLFMRPGSVVIILMQPGWCAWSWVYANQAVLLDVLPLIHCPAAKPESPLTAVGLSRRFWLQGPAPSKADDQTLSPPLLLRLLRTARRRYTALLQPQLLSAATSRCRYLRCSSRRLLVKSSTTDIGC